MVSSLSSLYRAASLCLYAFARARPERARCSDAGGGPEDEGGGDHGAGLASSGKNPHGLALIRFDSVRFEWVRAVPHLLVWVCSVEAFSWGF
jgi:hypothetical protein